MNTQGDRRPPGQRRPLRRLRCAGLLVALSGFAAFPPSALAQTTIDFEQYPEGTEITNQYANAGGPGQGVTFGPLPSGNPGEGLHPVIRVPPAGQAQSGSQVADIATCVGCEFFTPRTTGTFAEPRSQLSVRVGYLGEPGICTSTNPDAVTCAFVKLRAFGADGNQLAESSVRVTRGAGVKSPLSVSTPSASIVGFEISGRPAIDDSKPLAIDDLSFGAAGASRPDFTLNPATTNLIVEQGQSATVSITIGRLGGSTGDVALSAKGLTAGVSATFAPNPAPGTQSVLTISADPLAPPATRTALVAGTPQSASVGPAPRSFGLDITVQQACPRVDDAEDLVNKLADGFKCIFIVGRIDLAAGLAGVNVPPDLTDQTFGQETALVIPDGVTLIGGRSPTQVGGTLAMSGRTDKRFMLRVGSNTRITGLQLGGYKFTTETVGEKGDPTAAIYVRGGSGVVIDNNEIAGWPHAGIVVADADRRSPPLIDRNYIHSNLQCGLGYGVVTAAREAFELDAEAGFARIERNVFVFNRHDVASSGGPGPGYIAELNFVLNRGPTCKGNYNQNFDVHGENEGYGGRAGNLFEIRRNTIRGAQSYGGGLRPLTRPAFELRGTPVERAIFADNAVAHDSMYDAVRVKSRSRGDPGGALRKALIRAKRLIIRGNKGSVDTARELAVGDFNGDGRDDVFQAVGTLWVYSPSGRREWFFLNDSNLRLRSLGLGDFNGDGQTDVFFKDGDRWMVSYGGTSDPTALPEGSGIDIKHYRFGDFDGDGRTDVFRANGSRFFYSSAGSTKWLPLAASRLKIGELRFGDFDGDGKTDVFSLANNQWSVSYGGSTQWRRLNRKLSSKLGKLVFADFNGDGKTDIAVTDGRRWAISWAGASPWRKLADGRLELSIGMLFGDFNGDGRDDVLQHGSEMKSFRGARTFRSLEQFRLSSGGAGALKDWSRAFMR